MWRCLACIPRHLLNALTALSLVLLAAVLATGVRSLGRHESVQWRSLPDATGHERCGYVGWCGGNLGGEWTWTPVAPGNALPPGTSWYWQSGSAPWDAGLMGWPHLGFAWTWSTYDGTPSLGFADRWTARGIYAPHWFWAILFGLLPGVRGLTLIPRRRRRRRLLAGLCARCAYDLRGNTSGVCPECGAVATLEPAIGVNRPPKRRGSVLPCRAGGRG